MPAIPEPRIGFGVFDYDGKSAAPGGVAAQVGYGIIDSPPGVYTPVAVSREPYLDDYLEQAKTQAETLREIAKFDEGDSLRWLVGFKLRPYSLYSSYAVLYAIDDDDRYMSVTITFPHDAVAYIGKNQAELQRYLDGGPRVASYENGLFTCEDGTQFALIAMYDQTRKATVAATDSDKLRLMRRQ